MAGVARGTEVCPYCGKPFKRLKSHLPHCKMAGDRSTAFDSSKVPYSDLEASHAKPVRSLAPEKKKGQSKETTAIDNSSERESEKKAFDSTGNKESKLNPLQRGSFAGSEIASSLPAEKPGKNTKQQIKLASQKTHREEGMRLVQEEARMHTNAAEERTSEAKHAKKLPKPQKSRSKSTSGAENSTPAGILEPPSSTKDEKSASKFPRDPVRSSAKQKQRKVGPPAPEVAGSLDLPTDDLESIPMAAVEGAKVVIQNHRVKVLRNRTKSKIQGSLADGATTSNSMTQGCYAEVLAPDNCESQVATVQSDRWKNKNVIRAVNTHLELGGSNTLCAESEKGNSLTTAEVHTCTDGKEADCKKIPGSLSPLDRMDKNETKEMQFCLNRDVNSKAAFSASLSERPHSSARETLSRASEGLASHYLSCVQWLQKDEKQMGFLSEPALNAGRRNSELAWRHHLGHPSENQLTCLFRSSGRDIQTSSMGLEWFPELYPNYQRLSMLPGRPVQGDTEIKMKKMEPGFLEGPQVPLAERPLMDVKLQELPGWLAACDFSPKGLVRAVQKAWSCYYNKYIDVKKGGAAGISMMLAGYCILSYGWRYEHLKQDRWRRYH